MRYLFLLLYVCLFSSVLNSQTPDTIPPYLRCKQPEEVTVKYCTGTLNVSDIIDSLSDNTPPIYLGIHRKCMGEKFPETNYFKFSETDWGTQTVSAWAKDAMGNKSSCTTTVKVIPPTGAFCDPTIKFSYKTVAGKGIDSVLIKLQGQNCEADSFKWLYQLGTLSCCNGISGIFNTFGLAAPAPGYESRITIERNDQPLNGVTTYDLTLISKHVLGLELLDSPYKIIAADVNQDGKVTTFDIIVLRKLILGIIDELPNGKSWRFLPEGYVFPNPANPFDPPFPEQYYIPASKPFHPNNFPFIGVKIGDVNDSAFPGG